MNKRDNKLQIKDNGKWNYKNKEEALRDAIDDSNDRLEQFCDEKSHHFRKIIRLSCKEIIKNAPTKYFNWVKQNINSSFLFKHLWKIAYEGKDNLIIDESDIWDGVLYSSKQTNFWFYCKCK